MEQLEGGLNTEIQVIKAHLTEAECPQRERKDGIIGVGERATSQSELLETDGLTENELKAKIAGLESQLDARGDLLGERETEIAGLKTKLESQIESLKAYVEISESAGRTENELKAKIADLERQLEAQQGTLAARDMEVSEIKTKADPQIQFLKHQFDEREDEIRAKESALQQQQEKYQGEINELQNQLKEREEAMVGVREQAKSQNELLESEVQTEKKLKEKINDLEWQLATKEGILAERDTEVSDFKNKAVSQIQSLETQLRERDETLKTRESALKQLEARYQGEINALMAQLSQKENLLKRRDEAMAGGKNQSRSHVALLKVVRHTGGELKAIKSLILRRQWGPSLGY